MSTIKALEALFSEIIREAENNEEFAERLTGIFESSTVRLTAHSNESGRLQAKRPHKRPPGLLDPLAVYDEGGDSGLRGKLCELDVERLKDIVAEQGMDSSKLAMKWRTKDRLIDLIVSTVRERTRKGDAFRVRPLTGDRPLEQEGVGHSDAS